MRDGSRSVYMRDGSRSVYLMYLVTYSLTSCNMAENVRHMS